MIPIAGANCIYFEPSDSGGVCKHPDMKRKFWFLFYRKKCILAWIGSKSLLKTLRKSMRTGKSIECELQTPKITPVTKLIKLSKLMAKPKRKAPHIHKKHIHTLKEK